MSKTKIEWTEETWNPVTGCTKVSRGCKNCYAERIFHRPYPGRDFTDVRCHPERLDDPLHWRAPRRVFVNSMSDLFHENVPFEFIADVFRTMAAEHRHTFQVLTKRPERMLAFAKSIGEWEGWLTHNGHPPSSYGGTGVIVGSVSRWPAPNVWLGVSVEDQKTADERIPLLLQTPAAVRWVSAEPLLGPINLHSVLCKHAIPGDWVDNGFYFGEGSAKCEPRTESRLDWVVCGGESGPNARPMHPDWARSLRDQCQAAGAPFFFKQWGEWRPAERADPDFMKDSGGMRDYDSITLWPDSEEPNPLWSIRVGKKSAGRLLDGREWNEYPDSHQTEGR